MLAAGAPCGPRCRGTFLPRPSVGALPGVSPPCPSPGPARRLPTAARGVFRAPPNPGCVRPQTCSTRPRKRHLPNAASAPSSPAHWGGRSSLATPQPPTSGSDRGGRLPSPRPPSARIPARAHSFVSLEAHGSVLPLLCRSQLGLPFKAGSVQFSGMKVTNP